MGRPKTGEPNKTGPGTHYQTKYMRERRLPDERINGIIAAFQSKTNAVISWEYEDMGWIRVIGTYKDVKMELPIKRNVKDLNEALRKIQSRLRDK
jgi:hypothetical protein